MYWYWFNDPNLVDNSHIINSKDLYKFIFIKFVLSSCRLGLSLFWTNCRNYGMNLFDMVKLMCENTAKLASLSHRKGAIRAGYDADFVIWDPDVPFEVSKCFITHNVLLYIYLTVLYSWEMCHKKLVQFICTDFYCQNQPISLIVVINSVWKIYLVKTIDYCIYWIEDVMNSFRKICCSDLNIIHVLYIAICRLNCNFIRI